MPSALTRRQLLRGDLKPRPAALRPPWAVAEAAFLARCTRCDACIEACPPAILRRGAGGFPEVNFLRGACDFCGACVAACRDGALDDTQPAAWQATAVIADECLALRGVVCQSCIDACPSRALWAQPRIGAVPAPRVHATRCNGCGACVSACPVQAIAVQAHAAASPAEATA